MQFGSSPWIGLTQVHAILSHLHPGARDGTGSFFAVSDTDLLRLMGAPSVASRVLLPSIGIIVLLTTNEGLTGVHYVYATNMHTSLRTVVVHYFPPEGSTVGSYLRAQLHALDWTCTWIYHATQLDSNSCGFRALAFVSQRLRGVPLSGCLLRSFAWSCLQVLMEEGVDSSSMDSLLVSRLRLIDRQEDRPSQDVVTELVKEAIAEVEATPDGRLERTTRRKRRRGPTTVSTPEQVKHPKLLPTPTRSKGKHATFERSSPASHKVTTSAAGINLGLP